MAPLVPARRRRLSTWSEQFTRRVRRVSAPTTAEPSLGRCRVSRKRQCSDGVCPRALQQEQEEELDAMDVQQPLWHPCWEDEAMHKRWSMALSDRNIEDLNSEELAALVAEGVPLKHRFVLWMKWTSNLDSNSDEPNTMSSSDFYSLVEREVPEDVLEKIELDLPRTNPEWLGECRRHSLRRVLRAYAAHNPEAGYCQGINFIAAIFLLVGFDEAATFNGLKRILEDICPGYHHSGLEGYHRDARVLKALVQRLLPEVSERLTRLHMPIELLAIDHFIALTARNWPMAATIRLWDLLLLHGQKMLFASFLAILALYVPAGSTDMPDDHPMKSFKQAMHHGVSKHFDDVLQKTHELAACIPQSLLEELREEVPASA